MRPGRAVPAMTLGAGLCTLLFIVFAAVRDGVQRRALVLYSFSDTDGAYADNLRYFVREAIHPGNDYVVVLNGPTEFELPALPGNALYLRHDNACYDWGSYGWAMDRLSLWDAGYARFFFVNSSVRGPFMPAYSRVRWTDALASKLSAHVKLVGPTISCERTPAATGPDAGAPHVQSYAVATDAAGLAVMRAAGVFMCRDTLKAVILGSEIEASHAILRAGYGIDSLMHRYRGVDWRDPRNWACNGRTNPTQAAGSDGVPLEAMEVMFVKVKERYVDLYRWTSAVTATHYARPPAVSAMRRVVGSHAEVRSKRCFDVAYYLRANADLPRGWSRTQAYSHFVVNAWREGRIARYRSGCA